MANKDYQKYIDYVDEDVLAYCKSIESYSRQIFWGTIIIAISLGFGIITLLKGCPF